MTIRRTRKPRPPYWRVTNLLKKLRLKHRERNRDSASFHITIDGFGIVLRFNKGQPLPAYRDWDILDADIEAMEKDDTTFGRSLMWLLISKGYMAYLRDKESGYDRIYKHFLIDEGWGYRIIDRRLEYYNNEPRHKFLIERNKRLRGYSVNYIVTYHPDFFDYLF